MIDSSKYVSSRILASVLLLTAVAMVSSAKCASTGQLVVYPTVLGHEESEVFSLEVNGKPVPVEKVLQAHVAQFAFSGKADMKIAVRDRITNYQISPVSYRILSEPQGKHLSFSITQSRKLVVYINNYERLLIWADPLEKAPPKPGDEGVLNILDFGADPQGKHLATEKIHEAVQETPENGVLYFPPGKYLSGTISLKSNMTMYLAAGAMIQGSPLAEHYPAYQGMPESDALRRPGKHLTMGEHFSSSQLILIDGAENVKICGRGIIDGNGYIVRAQGKAAFLLKIRNSRNILVEDVVLRNPAAWNTHILYCEDVTVRNTKIVSDMRVKNTDGYDPDSSIHVLLEGNFAMCNDDTVAIKTTNNTGLLRNVEDVTVRGNVFISQASALKVGTESRAEYMRDITFIDNDVVECDRGMSLYCRDGAVYSDIKYINNRFERLFIEDRRSLLHFYIEDRFGKGQIRDVLVKDCIALVHWPSRPILKSEDLPLKVNGFVKEVTFSGSGK
jgi:hypothetical protein